MLIIKTFFKKEIKKWITGLDTSPIEGATELDFFYWELYMGSWSPLGPAEKEIFVEQFSPFNFRLLLETCMQAPRELRMAPDYIFFGLMIKNLWPEVLSEPINPGPKGVGWWKEQLREKLSPSVVSFLQRFRKF